MGESWSKNMFLLLLLTSFPPYVLVEVLKKIEKSNPAQTHVTLLVEFLHGGFFLSFFLSFYHRQNMAAKLDMWGRPHSIAE